MNLKSTTRRNFIGGSALLAAGSLMLPSTLMANEVRASNPDDLYLIGPKDGFSPHIGTMLSMMTMMRTWVVRQVQGLTTEQLDYQIDDTSNSIGAMLFHLAATERFYQLNTFEEIPWGQWEESENEAWAVAMGLGKEGREQLKGNPLEFYLEKLESVRNHTIEEFGKRDDEWLMKSELFFPLSPGKQGETNNYAKWFHVCEHESNHNGQIKFIRSRLPS